MSDKLLLMTRFFSIVLLSLLTVVSCTKNRESLDPEIEMALKSLDETLDQNTAIVEAKEARIASIRKNLLYSEPGLPQYQIYDALFEEYRVWICDSALFYAHRKEILADNLNDPDLINDAAKDIALRYITSGMYSSALSVIMKAEERTGTIFTQDQTCASLLYEIYHHMVLEFNDKYSLSEFVKHEAEYLEKSRLSADKGSAAYYNLLAKSMISEGKYGQLVIILQERLTDSHCTTHERAVYNYWIGKAYETMGDTKNAFLRYIMSARGDLESANREYRSLTCVAQLCFNSGMVGRAHRYIKQCQEDALIANAHRRLVEISSILSKVDDAYEQIIEEQSHSIKVRDLFLLLVVGLLILTLVYLILSLRKLSRSNHEISKNMKMVREANRIKEAYMGQFLALASNRADSLELYRSKLRALAKQTDFEGIQQELRSGEFINEELSNLYEIFDKTFLGLYPGFVEQLNALLRPEERITKDLPGGKLTNELRVEALIKLGITDSKQIAKFLKLSPTTVFNYRVKFRNASRHDRDSFEDRLKAIGR